MIEKNDRSCPANLDISELTYQEQIDLKIKINQLLWENGPSWMTLETADNLACEILAMIRGRRG